VVVVIYKCGENARFFLWDEKPPGSLFSVFGWGNIFLVVVMCLYFFLV
jgi:hypothetical protein